MVRKFVSHSREEETPEAKARWFQSLSISERIEVFCAFTDLALALDPTLPDRKDAQQTGRRIQVLSRE